MRIPHGDLLWSLTPGSFLMGLMEFTPRPHARRHTMFPSPVENPSGISELKRQGYQFCNWITPYSSLRNLKTVKYRHLEAHIPTYPPRKQVPPQDSRFFSFFIFLKLGAPQLKMELSLLCKQLPRDTPSTGESSALDRSDVPTDELLNYKTTWRGNIPPQIPEVFLPSSLHELAWTPGNLFGRMI